MEDHEKKSRMEKTNPCFPSNYVTIHDLRDRWLKQRRGQQQQQLNPKEENANQRHKHEEEELKAKQQKQSSRTGVLEKPDSVVLEAEKSEESEKLIKHKKKSARNWRYKRERANQSPSTAAVSESVAHAPSEIWSVANAPSVIEDVTVKHRVRTVSKKNRNWGRQKPKMESETNGNEKIEAVVAEEKKNESVTDEIKAKFENLSMKRQNVGRGGGRDRYTSSGFRKSDAGSGGGGGSTRFGGGRESSRTNRFGSRPRPNQVWVKKGDAVH